MKITFTPKKVPEPVVPVWKKGDILQHKSAKFCVILLDKVGDGFNYITIQNDSSVTPGTDFKFSPEYYVLFDGTITLSN